jgi:hypothetical protein
MGDPSLVGSRRCVVEAEVSLSLPG